MEPLRYKSTKALRDVSLGAFVVLDPAGRRTTLSAKPGVMIQFLLGLVFFKAIIGGFWMGL